MEVTDTGKEFMERFTAMLVAAPKQGKTTTAVSISERVDALPAPKMTELDDILIWQFDEDGSESLKGMNVSAPILRFDQVPGVDDNGKLSIIELSKRISEAFKLTQERIEKGLTKSVIIDTVSTLDNVWVAYLSQKYQDARSTGPMYNELLKKHMDLAAKFRSLDCNLIINCHAKYIGDPMAGGQEAAQAQKQKMQATATDANARIQPAITGKALTHWRSKVSSIWPLYQVRNGKGKVEGVYIRPYGGQGFEGGCRYKGLADKEVAHLGKLVEKIKSSN